MNSETEKRGDTDYRSNSLPEKTLQAPGPVEEIWLEHSGLLWQRKQLQVLQDQGG